MGLKVLRKGNIDIVDVCKVNNEYFNFVCAAGAFSDISYVVKRGSKKILGKLAYYFYALSQIFKRKMIEAEIETENEKFSLKTPFILVMSEADVGPAPRRGGIPHCHAGYHSQGFLGNTLPPTFLPNLQSHPINDI